VLGADAARGALRLSLAPKRGADKGAAAAGDASGFQPGDFARAVVVAAHAAAEGAAARFDVALLPLAEGEEGGGASGPIDVPVDAPRARLEAPHLSDAPAAAAALAEAAGPGADLGRVLVLERAPPAAGAPPGTPPRLRVTRKAALLAAAAAGRLPAELAELREGQVAPGFVASVTADAVFVRFLGGLTGRAGLAQLADAFVADPAALFAPGQTVRARVAGVDADKGRFGLALKHGATAGGDGGAGAAALLAAALADAELAARLAAAKEAAERGGAAGAPPDWAAALAVGALALGEVSEERVYGLVCDLAAHPDVVGLAAPHQAPAEGAPAPGAPVRAAVLDVSRRDGVVDLSLRPELVARAEAAAAAAGAEAAPAKRWRGAKAADAPTAPPLEVGAAVRVVVELVKPEEGYCVVSLPEGGAPGGPFLAFLPTADLNLQRSAAPARAPGDAVAAVVAALPSAATGGRLLLAAPLGAAEGAAAAAAAAAPAGEERPKGALPARGALVRGRVEAVHALHADVVLADGHRGRLHVSEAPGAAAGLAAPGAPAPAEGAPSPLAALAPGAELELVVLGRMPSAEGRRHGLLELSARAEALASAGAVPPRLPPRPLAWADLVPGAALRGYVQEAAPATGHLWIAFGPAVRGRAFLPAGRADAAAVAAAARALRPGAPVAAVVLASDAGRRALDVSLGAGPPPPAPAPGATALGVVTAVSGAGVRVQVGAAAAGRVALTDVHDGPVADALAGLAPRQVVRVAVLSRGSGGGGGGGGGGEAGLLALSLRPSRGGEAAAHAAAPVAPPGAPAPPEALAPADLAPGRRVAGYVRAAGRAGVFVALARGLDARVRLRQLADGFVDDPAAAFPEGRRVEGTVLKVEGGRVELTLKARRPPPSLEGLEPGRAVRGRVRRVEPFGVFVELRGGGGAPGGGPVGLAHVSELADGFVKDPAALFAVGQAVLGRVLSVDRAAGRLALTLKPSLAAGAAEEASGSESEGGGGADFDEALAAAAGAESGGEEEEEEADKEAEGGSEEESEEGGGAGAGGGFDLDADLLAADAGGSESD
jgi:rRNA biogenesis protein RRP5